MMIGKGSLLEKGETLVRNGPLFHNKMLSLFQLNVGTEEIVSGREWVKAGWIFGVNIVFSTCFLPTKYATR